MRIIHQTVSCYCP